MISEDTLSGADGAFRVWPDASGTNAAPLLAGGQTVTNGAGGVTFLSGADTDLYVEAVSNGTATLTYSYEGTGGAAGISCSASLKMTAWELELRSVELDTSGMPVAVGGKAVPGERIPAEASLSTYVPYDGGGAPDISSTSPRWVTFAAVTNAVTNSATLSMTQEDAEGFKVWELDFEGATTNGTFAWPWQGASNDFLRAEIPTNAAGAMMPLTLAYRDPGYDGVTNEMFESFSLYRHDETNGFWGSTYSITGPREEIGMPAFSANNAFVVRVPPEAAFAEGSDLVCRLLPDGEEDDAVDAEMERQPDGSYVTSLIVPMLDIDGDTGLESVTNAVKLKLKGDSDNPVWTGWQHVRINISRELDGSMQEIASQAVPVRRAALFSALVTNEENGEARANYGVKQAGDYARSHLGYGVTPLFSPDKAMLDNQFPRHRVWVHSGHGHNVGGVEIVQKQGNKYKAAALRAGDITRDDLEYDLVFMNTCLSIDVEFSQDINSETGWDEVPTVLSRHDVLDIGFKLNARNYVGWTCSVQRDVSIHVPTMLMTALNTYWENGAWKQRTVMEATAWVRGEMAKKRGAHEIFAPRLISTRPAGAELDETRFDLDGKPN